VADAVGAEFEPQRAGKRGHLGSDEGILAGTAGEHHAGVVDHAHRTDPVHEACGLEQELLGLEAAVARVILDEQAARVGQHQTGTLGAHALLAQAHAVRRGVVLHLLARTEGIFPGARRRRAQPRLPHPARERAVGDFEIVFGGEQLLHAHHVALSALEGRLQIGEGEAVVRRLLRRRQRCAQDAANGVTRELERSADLAQAAALGLQGSHRIADLAGGHGQSS
jgi:hypothetical protein